MAAALPGSRRAAVVPGLAAAAAIALCARFASEWLGSALFQVSRSPVSPIMLAVLAGVAIRSAIGVAPRLEAGVAMATTALLRIGLALIGLRLTLAGLGALGVQALPVVAGCLAVGWLVIPRLLRMLGLRGPLVTLLTVGTTVCGCTAIMACGPVIRARAEETGYAVTVVVMVGLTGMLLYPALAHGLFGDSPVAAGVFLGSAIHDTSQVLGAALLYGSQYQAESALDAATVTKLLRNLTLVLVVPALAALQARAMTSGPTATPPLHKLVPGFVIAFVALAALRSLGDAAGTSMPEPATLVWTEALRVANQVSELLLTVGMAGVGLSVALGDLRSVGWRPLAAGVLSALLLAATSMALVSALL